LTLTRQHGRPAGTAVSTVVQPRCRRAARRRPTLRRALVGLCLAAATATSGCSPPWAAGGSTNGDIPIGLIQALSGAAASIGMPATEIARREVDHVNATGGISGRKLRLVVADDRSDPNEAVRVTRNLIAQDHVAAIVGSTTGTSTLALLPVAAQQKTPVFSPNGTAALADQKSPYFPWLYLFAPMDSLSAPRQFSAATGAARRVAVFYQEDAYGRYGAELFDGLARQSGKEIVASTSAPLTGADLSAQITKIKSAAPDVVLMQTSITGLSRDSSSPPSSAARGRPRTGSTSSASSIRAIPLRSSRNSRPGWARPATSPRATSTRSSTPAASNWSPRQLEPPDRRSTVTP